MRLLSRSHRAMTGFFLAAGLLAPVAADAHAIVIGVDPAVESTVTGPDVPISIRFNSRIDQERSRLVLLGPGHSKQPLVIRAGDAPDRLLATAKGLAAGDYTVHWQVLAVDGHLTRGDIPFHVKAPTAP